MTNINSEESRQKSAIQAQNALGKAGIRSRLVQAGPQWVIQVDPKQIEKAREVLG